MRFVCLFTVLALSGCGGEEPTAEATWKLVPCDDFREEIGYAPTGIDGPRIPIDISRSWSSTIPVPPGATVKASYCNFYDQIDGVFVPDEALPFPGDGCFEPDLTATAAENGEVRLRCRDELIQFDNYYDYQPVPAPGEIITHMVYGWEEVYILVSPRSGDG